MGYPTFSHASMTSLVFSRGNIFPVPEPDDFAQLVTRSEGGQVRVTTVLPLETMLPLHFDDLPLEDIVAVRAWFRNALINGQASTFTYTDSAGTGFTVRLWQPTVVPIQTSFQRYSLDLLLRVES